MVSVVQVVTFCKVLDEFYCYIEWNSGNSKEMEFAMSYSSFTVKPSMPRTVSHTIKSVSSYFF